MIGGDTMEDMAPTKKIFNPKIEIFDPYKVPFSSENTNIIFDSKGMDACCACTACTACCACR